MGWKQTREFAFDKLVGYEHHPEGHYTRFSVANRQRPRSLGYGNLETAWCLRLDLAHSTFGDQRDVDLASPQQELDEHMSQRPPGD